MGSPITAGRRAGRSIEALKAELAIVICGTYWVAWEGHQRAVWTVFPYTNFWDHLGAIVLWREQGYNQVQGKIWSQAYRKRFFTHSITSRQHVMPLHAALILGAFARLLAFCLALSRIAFFDVREADGGNCK